MLMGLPVEIRLMILRFLVVASGCLYLSPAAVFTSSDNKHSKTYNTSASRQGPHAKFNKTTRPQLSKHSLHILRTCQVLWQEGLDLLTRENILQIPLDLAGRSKCEAEVAGFTTYGMFPLRLFQKLPNRNHIISNFAKIQLCIFFLDEHGIDQAWPEYKLDGLLNILRFFQTKLDGKFVDIVINKKRLLYGAPSEIPFDQLVGLFELVRCAHVTFSQFESSRWTHVKEIIESKRQVLDLPERADSFILSCLHCRAIARRMQEGDA